MSLIVLGLNHQTAPVEIREKISFSKERLKNAISKLTKDNCEVVEALILATCNRMEIYATTKNLNNGLEKIKEFLISYHQLKIPNLDRYLYVLQDEEAIKHIFKVACGLDSQILGENKILGQVREAYIVAKNLNKNHFINKLFSRAIEVGKRVRKETKISEGNLSFGSVALNFAERELGFLQRKNILLIGAGKISELIVNYLIVKGTNTVIVSNRTYEKAVHLAKKLEGKAIRFDSLREELNIVDIVLCSTSAQHYVLKKEIFDGIKREKPLLIFDLSLPRNVSPDIKGIDNISLYDLDDLNATIEENYKQRQDEAKIAEIIVDEEVQKFKNEISNIKGMKNYKT